MLEMQQGVKLYEIEWMHLTTQGVRKLYLLDREIMSGDSVIQLVWALGLTLGQVCQRLKQREIKLNVEGTRRSRAHDS
jgi:hypothetical protein